MSEQTFTEKRRQVYIDEPSYRATLQHYIETEVLYREDLQDASLGPLERRTMHMVIANAKWTAFQLKYTGGENLAELRRDFPAVIAAFQDYVTAATDVPDGDYVPPFLLDDLDVYLDYVNLLAFAVLLCRGDLVGQIHGFIEGTDYDGTDAVVEECLKFFLPGRPSIDSWYHEQYRTLLDSVDSPDEEEQSKKMAKYVKGWYKGMKGVASFWGKHEEKTGEFTPYYGYWALCAGLFAYLYGMDDRECRDVVVYPSDLVDFAREPGMDVLESSATPLSILGGRPCPRAGYWVTPAKENSRAFFNRNDVMPVYTESDFGLTIWQFNGEK